MKNEVVITKSIFDRSKGKIVSRGYKAFYTLEFRGKVKEYRIIDRLPDMVAFDRMGYHNSKDLGAVACQDGFVYVWRK